MPLPAVKTTKLLDFRVRLYDIALLLLRHAYIVSPPQLVTLRYNVLDPVMPQMPPAKLLTDLRLPGTSTIVVLHGFHQTMLAMNAEFTCNGNSELQWQMHRESDKKKLMQHPTAAQP